MLSDQDVFNLGMALGLLLTGQAEPSVDLDKATNDGFFTLNLRDKRDGTTLVLKVTEIKLQLPEKK